MKDLLLVLFYRATVAVNTAVVLSGIIWLAKRKDEKDGRKPNLDFTPPPKRHSGGYQPKPSEMPKPPTTGTSVVKPNPQGEEVYIREIRGDIGNRVLRTVTMRCGTCRWHDDNDMCHCEAVCNPERKPYFAAAKMPGNRAPCKYWEMALIVDDRGNETPKSGRCEKCKYFLANYAGDFGYCVQNEEIKHPYEAHGCFEKREGKDHERQNL